MPQKHRLDRSGRNGGSVFQIILWDVDGTLLDFLYSQEHSLRNCCREFGLECSDGMIQRYKEINDDYWRRLELGEVTKAQLLTGRFLTWFEEYHIHGVDLERFLRLYQHNLGNIYRYRDDSLHICRLLRGRVKQYVITNGVAATQENKLVISGLAECMEALFISETIGAPKPQRAFFEYCFREIESREGGIDRDRILIIGDSLTSDIKGGIQMGIPTCWYRPEGLLKDNPPVRENYEKYRPDYEISDLHQIFDILEGEHPWQNQRDKS